MIFQVSNFKGNYFLDLLNNNLLLIKPTYIKNNAWLKSIVHLNFLCVRMTRAITNHMPIGKYHLRFFPREYFSYSYNLYPIESRQHILYKCKRYNNY